MAAIGRSRASCATAVPSTCTVSTRLLPRSEGPGGWVVDATARSRHRIAASLCQHPSRSTACLTTLHEPWPHPGDRRIPDFAGALGHRNYSAGRWDPDVSAGEFSEDVEG